MLKAFLKKYKQEVLVFLGVIIVYSVISCIFFKNTTVLYDTNSTYDVLLDTDSGVLFKWNTFAVNNDDSKHILFSAIVSVVGYPLYILSIIASKLLNLSSDLMYGIALTFLQICVSAFSITIIFNYLKNLKLKRLSIILLLLIQTFSFPQLFMTLNIERFIYGQLSIILFIFISYKKSDKPYLIDLAAIPLFGITITNVYLYLIYLIIKYRINIKQVFKHISFFSIITSIIIIVSKSYGSVYSLFDQVEYNVKYISDSGLIEKIKLMATRLFYPTLYFPGNDILDNTYLVQDSNVNYLFLTIVGIVVVLCIISAIRYNKGIVTQLTISVLIFNIFLHGVVGYNLLNANIMTIHFSFGIVILLGNLYKGLSESLSKSLNIFITLVLITVLISNINGFVNIFNFGIERYPF